MSLDNNLISDTIKLVLDNQITNIFPDKNNTSSLGYMLMKKDNINSWIDLNSSSLGTEFNEVFINYKKYFDGIIDDFVNDQLLKSEKYFDNFVNLVFSTFDNAINSYIQQKKIKTNLNINQNDIIFLYKGGNLIKLTYKKFREDYENNKASLNNIVYDELKKFDAEYNYLYKKSDNDFTIYINSNNLNENEFNSVHNDIVILSYLLLNLIRNQLLSNLPNYFDYYKDTTDEEKSKILKDEILKKMNNSIDNKKIQQKLGKFIVVQLDNIFSFSDDYYSYENSLIKEKKIIGTSNLNGNGKNDTIVRNLDNKNSKYIIIQSIVSPHQNANMTMTNNMSESYKIAAKKYKDDILKLKNINKIADDILVDMRNENVSQQLVNSTQTKVKNIISYFSEMKNKMTNIVSPLFITVNKTIKFERNDLNEGKQIATEFNLVRMKINVTGGYLNPKVGEYQKGCNLRNLESCKYNFGGELIDVSIPTYLDGDRSHFFDQLQNNVKNYMISGKQVKGYSFEYLMYDLTKMIFIENEYPWLVRKYGKRLDRYFLLMLIYIYNDYMNASSNNKKNLIKEYAILIGQIRTFIEIIYMEIKNAINQTYTEQINLHIKIYKYYNSFLNEYKQITTNYVSQFFKNQIFVLSNNILHSMKNVDKLQFIQLMKKYHENFKNIENVIRPMQQDILVGGGTMIHDYKFQYKKYRNRYKNKKYKRKYY